MLLSAGYKPWDIGRLTMRDIVDIARAVEWAQEQPGSNAWLLAKWLEAKGCDVPWTARTLLGRPEHG